MISGPERDGVLLVKAKGGLGNRMLCAATGVAWGMLARRRVIVDWRDGAYEEPGRDAFRRLFRATGCDPEAAFPDEATDVAPPVWRDHLDWSVSRMIHAYDPTKHSSFRIQRKYSIDPRRLDPPERVVVLWAYTHMMHALLPHFGGMPGGDWPRDAERALGRLLRDHLRPEPGIARRIDGAADALLGARMIGVHVRHSDRRANVDRYLAAVAAAREAEPEAGVFVATDNRAVLDRFAAAFPGVVATEKWYPDAGATMHQNDACPDRLGNAIEALLDMHLLARCDRLIYPKGSTFSWCSALIGGLPRERTRDMERFDLRVRAARAARRLLA